MRIGILTLPLHTNYGGILQAYALQTVLERMGHEVEVIKWKEPEFKGYPFYRAILIYAKRLILGIELRFEYRKQQEKKIVYQHLQESVDRMIHYTNQMIDNRQSLIDYCNRAEFDALVVGSDQVWRKSYGKKSLSERIFKNVSFPNLDTFYLDFAVELKSQPLKIAYAASFGVDYSEYTAAEASRYGALLSTFDAVSVREQQGVNLITDTYSWAVDAKCVLDPTMLLEADDYKVVCDGSDSKAKHPYLFYYVLDESKEKSELLSNLATKLSLDVVRVSPNSAVGLPEERVLPSVEEWLSLIASADFVLTDSFHGMLFSIIFHKPFYVIGNEKRGMARFDSLLETFKISDRLVYKNKINLSRLKTIQWQHLNMLINVCRQESIKTLFSFVHDEWA